MAEEAKWYVAHTYSGYENTVKATIEKAVENRNMGDLILGVNIPMETVTEITDSGSKTVERKVFPGYVLVKMVMTDETWHLVRNVRGVTGFVGSGNKAIPLTDEEIDYYVDRFRPFDKAGSYGIQEWIGYVAIERIEGSFYNVMGLPVQKVYTELNKFLNA